MPVRKRQEVQEMLRYVGRLLRSGGAKEGGDGLIICGRIGCEAEDVWGVVNDKSTADTVVAGVELGTHDGGVFRRDQRIAAGLDEQDGAGRFVDRVDWRDQAVVQIQAMLQEPGCGALEDCAGETEETGVKDACPADIGEGRIGDDAGDTSLGQAGGGQSDRRAHADSEQGDHT